MKGKIKLGVSIKILLMSLTTILFVACGSGGSGGSGGSSSSSSGFAPANANAFEAKFINQTITTNTGVVSTIVSNKSFSQTGGGIIIIVPYIYTNTGANTATSLHIVNAITCTDVLEFTSELSGTISETCDDGTSGSGSFTFSGAN